MWAVKYIGQEYKPRECIKFVEDTINKEFNGNVKFPSQSNRYLQDINDLNKYANDNLKTTIHPKDGDIIVMNGKRIACHVGLIAWHNGSIYVLHGEVKTSCISLHRLEDLNKYGYSIHRFLKWK